MLRINMWVYGFVSCLMLNQAWADDVVPLPKANMLSETEWRELATQRNCLYCHAIDHKVVGPAYKDVAAAWAGKPDAEEKLLKKVSEGGGGRWGDAAMPPQSPQASSEEIRALLRFILSLK